MQQVMEQLAASRMQVVAYHNAMQAVRAYLDNAGKLPEALAKQMGEALEFTSPTGVALFETMRQMAAVAQDPMRHMELVELGVRIDTLLENADGAL